MGALDEEGGGWSGQWKRSSGIEVVDGGDGGVSGPNDEIAVGISFLLSFECTKGPDEGAGNMI